MSFRKVNITLIGIMVIIAMVILASTLTALYQVALDQSRENLTRTALSQTRLLESVALFDQEYSADYPDGSLSATFSQINEAFNSLEKIGETGEFLLAQKQGENINFLLISPGGGELVPRGVPSGSVLAEPMRRALNGYGGVMIGKDYDGVEVLAAYQPVKTLNFGIVVKIDIAEVRAPFLEMGGFLIFFSMLLTGLGAALFLRVNNPMIRRIKESEQRYHRAVDGTNDGIWDWNIKTGDDYFSPRWAEILGYDFSDLKPVVATFTNIIHPDDRDLVWHHVNTHLEFKTPFDMEFRMRKKDGEYIWVQSRGRASRDEFGQPTYMAGSIIDITDRRLYEDNLRVAKKEANQASKAKSEFLASMSHELRTPLNAVLGFGQMLLLNSEETLSKTQSEYVENILTGGNYLLKLINEILDLSQIEADQAAIFLEEVDAVETIQNCITQVQPLGEERGIKVINQIKAGAKALLRTDQLRFEQIIINLLSNAVKYNNDGGTIIVSYQETKEGFLRILIADTGIGIAEQDYVNVFNMFQRLGSHSAITREGNGIGLAICKLLTEQMGGRIDFESEEGVGTTFWIELPLASNDMILIWSDNLRVGVDPIDKDHQVIIFLINKISSGFCQEAELNNVIIELIEYTEYHFRREETIMEVCDFPKLIEHQEYHQKLVAQVHELARDWRENKDPEMRYRLCRFLRDWWIGHILNVDVEIAQFATGKTQEIRQALNNLENN